MLIENKRYKYKQLVAITVLLFCPLLFAQTDQVESSVDESINSSSAQKIDQTKDVQQARNSEGSNTAGDNQVFIPSEEISEDAPVAFPIDI